MGGERGGGKAREAKGSYTFHTVGENQANTICPERQDNAIVGWLRTDLILTFTSKLGKGELVSTTGRHTSYKQAENQDVIHQS